MAESGSILKCYQSEVFRRSPGSEPPGTLPKIGHLVGRLDTMTDGYPRSRAAPRWGSGGPAGRSNATPDQLSLWTPAVGPEYAPVLGDPGGRELAERALGL